MVARGIAEAAGLTVATLGAVSVRSALGDIEVPEVEVRLPRLPPALSGFTIVQLSDVHIGPTIGRRFVEHVVEKSNAQKPDAIVITGDLVDGSVATLRQHVEPLAKLKARHGVFFVTGNHEYYSGVDEWLTELERLGIRVLRNERVSLGDSDASLDLAGVDDHHANGFGPGHGADYDKPFRGRDPERELVVLAHQPSQITRLAPARPGLQLSGHTHGGQIWPFGALVRLNQPYVAGLHRHDDTTQIYVSRGTGYWGPPMRLFCPAEITKLVLSAA
jgi:predicted MPP superfamily phosphohydrolase